MRPARRRSHNSHAHGRTGTRARVRGGATLALILAGIVSVTLASHSTTTWDFGTASQYTYDATKIAVETGVAHLKKSFTVAHTNQTDFNAGTYTTNTVYDVPGAAVKMTNVATATTSAPVTGTYTSPVIDAGVATTTWKTLSHARVLQQAAPPATFGAKTSVLPTLSSSTEITAADFNRDGAVDIVATATSGTRRLWLYQSNAGNPPTFTQVPITESATAPCTGADNGLSAVATARYGVADLDNDLDLDLIEPGQQTINTNPLFIYINPLAA